MERVAYPAIAHGPSSPVNTGTFNGAHTALINDAFAATWLSVGTYNASLLLAAVCATVLISLLSEKV